MRITTNSTFTAYQRNITDTQQRIDRTNQQITSQKQMIRLSDDAVRLGEIQDLNSIIDRNASYNKNLEEAITELMNTEEHLERFANTADSARLIALDAANPTNFDKAPVFARQLRDVLDDLVNQANADFNGRFLFGGTKTTSAAITPVAPETTNLPFEIITEAATPANPSGLRVAFKGNNETRTINRSASATEPVNITALEAFGTGGNEVFQNIINAYNTLAFNSDGSARTSTDKLTESETVLLQNAVKGLSTSFDSVSEATARTGSRISRLTAITEQMTEESFRLKVLRSEREDTDIAAASIALRKDEMSLQYSLQVGAKLSQQSLLDFIR
ncbi:MAG TPA: hypothetical protein VEC36_10105 [Patescibacteria group bacterium]|nr:hypothetical protein [Patescibacteria group bacterium]